MIEAIEAFDCTFGKAELSDFADWLWRNALKVPGLPIELPAKNGLNVRGLQVHRIMLGIDHAELLPPDSDKPYYRYIIHGVIRILGEKDGKGEMEEKPVGSIVEVELFKAGSGTQVVGRYELEYGMYGLGAYMGRLYDKMRRVFRPIDVTTLTDEAATTFQARLSSNGTRIEAWRGIEQKDGASRRKPGHPGLSEEELVYRLAKAQEAEEIRRNNPDKCWKEIAKDIKWSKGNEAPGLALLKDARQRLCRLTPPNPLLDKVAEYRAKETKKTKEM